MQNHASLTFLPSHRNTLDQPTVHLARRLGNRRIWESDRPFENSTTPRFLDSFPRDLCFCRHLLIGFKVVERDHGG